MSATMCKRVETDENSIYVCRWEYLFYFQVVSMGYKLGLLSICLCRCESFKTQQASNYPSGEILLAELRVVSGQ